MSIILNRHFKKSDILQILISKTQKLSEIVNILTPSLN